MEPQNQAKQPRRRQARLRNEFAAWYPTIAVNCWTPAVTLARKVAQQLSGDGPAWAPRWERGARILDDRHFDFRGGLSRPAHLRTRSEDAGGGGAAEMTDLAW